MSSRPADFPVRQTYRGLALSLRGRSGLTQRELAALLRVSERAVQKWEAGQSYPSAEHLRQLIALYRQRGVFAPGARCSGGDGAVGGPA